MRVLWSVNIWNREQLWYVIYWHPEFTFSYRPMKMYWWINTMQKLQQNMIFFNRNFINTIIPLLFIQATDITAHQNIITGTFISFLWMETGCKLGSPDKFENHKLYCNTITQQNEREPGVVLNSRKNMMINLAF